MRLSLANLQFIASSSHSFLLYLIRRLLILVSIALYILNSMPIYSLDGHHALMAIIDLMTNIRTGHRGAPNRLMSTSTSGIIGNTKSVVGGIRSRLLKGKWDDGVYSSHNQFSSSMWRKQLFLNIIVWSTTAASLIYIVLSVSRIFNKGYKF